MKTIEEALKENPEALFCFDSVIGQTVGDYSNLKDKLRYHLEVDDYGKPNVYLINYLPEQVNIDNLWEEIINAK